jgi:hypothetical protein
MSHLELEHVSCRDPFLYFYSLHASLFWFCKRNAFLSCHFNPIGITTLLLGNYDGLSMLIRRSLLHFCLPFLVPLLKQLSEES